MQFLAWGFIGLMALLLMFFWMLFERRVPITSVTSAFLWLIWAWEATSVTYGTTVIVEQGYPTLRWFGVFLALINLILLALWLWMDSDEELFNQI